MAENHDSITELLDPDTLLAQLTERQRQFVLHTYKGFDGVEAARRAGYTGNNLATQASRLLRHPKVAKALEALALAGHRGSLENGPEALKLGLWAIARSAHPRDRISATALLHRIEEAERAREPEVPPLAEHYLGKPGGMERLQTDLLEMMLKVLGDDLKRGFLPYQDEAHREYLREVARLATAIAKMPRGPVIS